MQPGLWIPPGLLVGSGGSSALTFVNSIVGSGDPLAFPAGTRTGDLLICSQKYDQTFGPVPEGFSLLHGKYYAGINPTILRLNLSWRIVDGTEGEVISGGGNKVLMTFRYRGVSNVVKGVVDESTSYNNPSSCSINASGAALPAIIFGLYAGHYSVPNPTFTPAEDVSISGSRHEVRFKIFNNEPPPSNVSIDMGDSGDASLMVLLALTVS